MIHRINKIAKLNLKSRGHAIERLAVDAENFRGTFSIATGRVEDVEDVASLDFVEIGKAGKKLAEIVCGQWWRFM